MPLSYCLVGTSKNMDGSCPGLPALDVSIAFPQATSASLFPPAGETD